METVDRLVKQLRDLASNAGLQFAGNFKFHQSRATFGTQLARMLIEAVGVSAAIDFVRRAMLHRSEATTLKYIKFIENTKAKQKLADAFSRLFTGVTSHRWSASDES